MLQLFVDGSSPQTQFGSLRRSPDSLAGFNGPLCEVCGRKGIRTVKRKKEIKGRKGERDEKQEE